VIETEELTRDFPSGRALDGLTIDVRAGEVLALLGPNGAGKTTTVRLLDGVLAPTHGRSRVLGFDPATEGDEVRRRTGVLTETAGLDDRLTARENMEYTARLRGLTPGDAARRTSEMIDRFGLGLLAGRLTQGFSTGQRKRVALARALLHEPEILFLDEPTSGLDPSATREVIALIDQMASEGRTIVLCTHFLGEAGRLAHRMGVLHRGRLRAFGTPAELAGAMFTGIPADVELANPAEERLTGAVAALPGVLSARSSPRGLALRLERADVLPVVIATLVGREVPVFAATPYPPTLEDVYFAVEASLEAEDAAVGGAPAVVPVAVTA
jgi:ABC-2 type transport system ATP-binding protein